MKRRQRERLWRFLEELNVTRTADKLHVAQSAVTKSIQDLESELGTTPLIRSTHRVDLIEAGRAFLVGIRRTLASLQPRAKPQVP
jgi:DNA-binding transcriptional LysR family regulator